VTEDEQEEEASLRHGREGRVGRDEQLDDVMEDEHEGESCSTECSGRTGRRLAHFEGDEVARKARWRLSGDRKLQLVMTVPMLSQSHLVYRLQYARGDIAQSCCQEKVGPSLLPERLGCL
jgi:hypothetical protein